MTLPPYSFVQSITAWTFDLPVVIFVAVLVLWYGWRVFCAYRRGVAWPWWRSLLFVVVGMGSILIATMSSFAVYQHTVLWALVVQLALLLAIVPVAVASGDPIGLLRAGSSEAGRQRLERILASGVARVLTFPVVAAVLGMIVHMYVLFGPVLRPALTHGWVMNLMYLVVLAVGCLLAWPMLGEDLLPSWCTPGLRLLFAVLDGLLDAIPGIALAGATSLIAGGYYAEHLPWWSSDPHYDQQTAGTMAVAVAEAVAVPLLALVFAQWARSELKANKVDAAPSGDESSVHATPAPELERPWWETEGGYGRGRRTEEYRGR